MKALLLALLLAGASLAALAFTFPGGDVRGIVDLGDRGLPAPPELRLLTPTDGEGVDEDVLLAGQAVSRAQNVIDVQYRVDGERWTSIPDIARGQRTVNFRMPLTLAPGDHVLEARAWDGDAYSLPARVEVRRDAPTLRIHTPTEGGGVPAGTLEIAGSVAGTARSVLVEAGDQRVETPVVGGAWNARLDLAPGLHRIRATALAPTPSLPVLREVAAGDPAPGTVALATPHEAASYGEAGDITCGGACILFTGTLRGDGPLAATIDGLPAGHASLLPGGAWTYRLPVARLASGPHVATFATPGGAPQSVTFLARTPLELDVRGDEAARPTLTPLRFHAAGEGADNASWTIDGTEVATGRTATLHLTRPGDHTLTVRTELPQGRAATTTLSLHAINRPPTVTLGTPALVGADIELRADALDLDGPIVRYQWELGDGTNTTTTEPMLRHRYAARGTYTANLTVVDDRGATARATTLVLVPNVAPLANFTWEPDQPTIHDVVTLRDTSLDLDGKLVHRTWTLPDGNTSTNATPRFRPPTRGDLPVTLTVHDDGGTSVTLTRLLPVANLPPLASFTWEPATPRVHEEILLRDTSTDPDGNITIRRWDLGDGTNATGPGVLHRYRTPGLYHVVLTVHDDAGATTDLTLPLLVADGEPTLTAVIVDPPHPRAQDQVRLRLLATDREGALVALHWHLGDGTTSTDFEPLHRYPRSGIYRGNVTAYDEAGLHATLPFHLTIANAPPTGTLHLERGGHAGLPTTLVANATDPDGRISLYRFDADGDGRTDCATPEPRCEHTYLEAGPHLARVWIEDDEAAIHEAQTILDILTPPSHLAPPRVTISSPSPHATLRGEHLLRGDATGVRPIAKIEIQLRNDSWAYSGTRDAWRHANGGLSWTDLLDTRRFTDGDYDLVVRATDEGGGQGITRLPITIHNGPRPSDVHLQLLDTPTEIEDDITIRGSAFHPQGVTSVRWRIDDGRWHYVSTSPLAFTIPLDRDALPPGPHTLHIEAYRGPTEKAERILPFTVPGTPPTLIVDTPPPPTAYGLLHATGRIHGPGHAQWRLDHGVWRDLPSNGTWTLTHETQDILGGTHTLDIRAVSPDGRLHSPHRTWRIDILNPPFARDAPPPPPPPLELDVPLLPWLAGAALGIAAAGRRRDAGR